MTVKLLRPLLRTSFQSQIPQLQGRMFGIHSGRAYFK